MASFGEKLRRARRHSRVQIRDVARETRIDVRHLEALERNDFEKLPGGAFNKGFVRTYAQFLGLDPAMAVRDYEDEVEAQRQTGRMPEPQDLLEKIRGSVGHRTEAGGGWKRGRLVVVFAALLLVFLVATRLWLMFYDASEAPAGRAAVTRPEAPAREPAPEPTAPAPDETPVPQAPQVEGAATDEPVAGEPSTVPAEAPSGEAVEQAAAPDSSPELEIPDAGVGGRIVDLELADRRQRFEEGSSVFFWTRVVGAEPGTEIRHVWTREGETVGYVPLRIGATHWRTYSRRDLEENATGRWTVTAIDDNGRILARETFECVPRNQDPGNSTAG